MNMRVTWVAAMLSLGMGGSASAAWGGHPISGAWVLAMAGEPPPPPKCMKDEDCKDHDLCTRDLCRKDGTCEHKPVTCDDGKVCTLDRCDPKKGCHHVNQCPDCTKAKASVTTLWPPNHKFVSVGVTGVTDPQGQATTISIHGVAQDEPTNAAGDGNTCPDAMVGQGTASLRSERSGTGDGRVYHLFFTAKDPDGHTCSGEVKVCVPHDRGRGEECVDGGPLYDSLSCSP